MAEWDLEWKIAVIKRGDAKWQYQIAEHALARATAVLNEAERECNRLFQRRVHMTETELKSHEITADRT